MKKGDIVSLELEGRKCKARIIAATKMGFRVIWQTGFLKGREALIARELLVHRGRPRKEK